MEGMEIDRPVRVDDKMKGAHEGWYMEWREGCNSAVRWVCGCCCEISWLSIRGIMGDDEDCAVEK